MKEGGVRIAVVSIDHLDHTSYRGKYFHFFRSGVPGMQEDQVLGELRLVCLDFGQAVQELPNPSTFPSAPLPAVEFPYSYSAPETG